MRELVGQSDKMLALIARRFRMLSEPYRLRLLQLLQSGEKTVTDLVQALDGNQPNVSKHLQLMHHAGLLSRRREGTSIYYGIADPMVLTLCDIVCLSAAEKAREDFHELGGVHASSNRGSRPSARRASGVSR